MEIWFIVYLLVLVAPGVKTEEVDDYYNIDNLSYPQAQDREFYRYLVHVMKVIEKSPQFVERYETLSKETHHKNYTIHKGLRIVTDGLWHVLSNEIKEQLNRLKENEIKYQRKLLAANKNHMAKVEQNEWNPIHHEDKKMFSQNDLTLLFTRFKDLEKMLDEGRRQSFKEYAMKKELEHRKIIQTGTKEEKTKEKAQYNHHHNKKHEPMHEPLHIEQMLEDWEEQHGLDRENFDYKTYFNMHDTDSDGKVEKYELETFFIHELDKVYKENDPDTDVFERQEELERMREKAMFMMDSNFDHYVSQEEFLKGTEATKDARDKGWTPLTEKKQFSEEELEIYRSQLKPEGS